MEKAKMVAIIILSFITYLAISRLVSDDLMTNYTAACLGTITMVACALIDKINKLKK